LDYAVRSTEAIGAFREAIRLAPQYAGAYFNLGNTLAQQGSMAEAIEAYQTAVQLDPRDAGGFMNLGNALMAEQRFDEAAKAFETVLALNPSHGRALQALEFAQARRARLPGR
jgi:tetratricopeptide (TPR) repeat protein